MAYRKKSSMTSWLVKALVLGVILVVGANYSEKVKTYASKIPFIGGMFNSSESPKN